MTKPKKEPTPFSEQHREYVDQLLCAMWGRSTGLAHVEAIHASRLSLKIRTGKLPLADGSMPTPQQAGDVIRAMRTRNGNRGHTLGQVEPKWQMVVDDIANQLPLPPITRHQFRPTGARRPASPEGFRR